MHSRSTDCTELSALLVMTRSWQPRWQWITSAAMLSQVFTTRPSGHTIKTHGLIRIRGEQAASASHAECIQLQLVS